jgi:cysteine desulfurase/selenocysteine lyase
MAREVLSGSESFVEPPGRFEAGTPNVAGALALAEAVRYLSELGMAGVCEHDRDLTAYCRQALLSVPGLALIGNADDALGVVSFVHPDVHPHDLSTVCDARGVAIRAGHHCAQPVMRRYGVVATARASFGVYNTRADVDVLTEAVRAAVELFAV